MAMDTALQMASFVAASKARSRVLPARSCAGTSTLQPIWSWLDLWLLPKAVASVMGLSRPQWLSPPCCCAWRRRWCRRPSGRRTPTGYFSMPWLQSTGCVHLTHVQRSRLIRMDGYTMYIECTRGKQRSLRAGFLWSAPRFGVAEDTDFGASFVKAVQALPAKASPCSVAFDLSTGAEVAPATIRSVVQLTMAPLMYAGEVHKVSSKSWRELPVTLSFSAGLGATDVCAIGNWLDSASQGCNVSPGVTIGLNSSTQPRLSTGFALCLRTLCWIRPGARGKRLTKAFCSNLWSAPWKLPQLSWPFRPPLCINSAGSATYLGSKPSVCRRRLPPLSFGEPSSRCVSPSRS